MHLYIILYVSRFSSYSKLMLLSCKLIRLKIKFVPVNLICDNHVKLDMADKKIEASSFFCLRGIKISIQIIELIYQFGP